MKTVSSKGQVTIPQPIRNHMGIHPGDKVDFVLEDGKTVFKVIRQNRRSFAEWAGAFPAFDRPGEHDAWFEDLRGDHPGRYE